MERIALTTTKTYSIEESTPNNTGAKCRRHIEHGKGSHRSVDKRRRKLRKLETVKRDQARREMEARQNPAQVSHS
jgi:hypothetical protein